METIDKPNIVASKLGVEAAPFPSRKADVYVFQKSPGGWSAVCPSLEGAEVHNAMSAGVARTDLSHLIGEIVLKSWGQHKPAPWREAKGFKVPDGAIHRVYTVSA